MSEIGGKGIKRTAVGSLLRGSGESAESFCNRIRSKLDYLGSVCEVHFAWYTHRNLAGCWICDSICAISVLLDEYEKLLPFVVEGTEHLKEAEPLNGEVPHKDS